ncbi:MULTISPECIES: CpsB/CapC family capsule biosynthesis tyrosine phosphatase [Clostridium]|uniref:tyrosine-protein phosphatase n=1 Tax=Clostridium TaxID=1485 RepID=UPI00189B8E2E|nr:MULTISPECIES: CpsB/CapC family capsule biosynthesis tyrosine phosphatase [Clostridium]MDI9217080.1 capsular biosynthesis protein [Clostridium tertium]
MVDLHSHLIWEIDDGSKSRDMTLNMLRQAIGGGTSKLVLTPHYMPGYFEVPLEEVKKKVEDVRSLIKEENLDIEIYQGQEVYYTSSILENYINNYIGTINDSRYMLIEFNMRDFSIKEAIENIYELQLKGIVLVIAHPERYQKFIKNPSLINEFIKEGFLFQVNKDSLTGDFGKEVKKTTEIYLKNNIYSFIGSDAHRDIKRNPDMRKAMDYLESLDEKYANYLLDSGEDLLNNKEIKFQGSLIKEKKGLFGIFNKV